MSRARFSVVYDGTALVDHTMDVRELAPALLAIGEMFDAASLALNGDATEVRVNVRAHEPGCFSIDLDVVQNIIKQGIALLSGDQITAAINLKGLLVGALGGGASLISFIRWLRGRNPARIERLNDSMVRVTIDGNSIDVPLRLMRLYQDIAVRTAVEKVVERPLEREGIETVQFWRPDNPPLRFTKMTQNYIERRLLTMKCLSTIYVKPRFPLFHLLSRKTISGVFMMD